MTEELRVTEEPKGRFLGQVLIQLPHDQFGIGAVFVAEQGIVRP